MIRFPRAMFSLGVAAGLASGACAPSVENTPSTPVVTAEFDPTTNNIPLPNDLAFTQDPNSLCGAAAGAPQANGTDCAQAELFKYFASFGGPLGGSYPSDQSLPVTVNFVETTIVNGSAVNTAPDLDLTTFTPTTFFVYAKNNGGTGTVAINPLSYAKGSDQGTLTIENAGNQPWAPGTYAIEIRGGANGVKTTDGTPVFPSEIFDLVEQGLDLTNPANNGLLKAQYGSEEAAIALGKQLNELESIYEELAFPAADTVFPHQELAITATFTIAPTVTNVTIDPARGLVPLPIDLLRDPTTGHLSALAACTLAGSSLSADGTCPSSAAAGFEALDGFSTTGAILAPTSDLVEGSTVNSTTVQLYDLGSNAATPALVDPTSVIFEPCEFTSGCSDAIPLSPVVAIQPAGATGSDASSVFRTRPLKDATDYAVVITNGVHDKAGNGLGRGTVAQILTFENPLVVGGHSALTGIDDTTAASLEKMRLQLQPVFTQLGSDASNVAIAYTFHTQTILSQAVDLAALPYTEDDTTGVPSMTITHEEAGSAFTKYGVDPTIPHDNIQEILETDITTFNALDPATGAFLADPTMAADETIHVLIAIPKASATPACAGVLAALSPLHCAPLMVYRHGLTRGRADMLTVADTNAAAGLVTVAIDAAKHGDRSFCTPGEPGQCLNGGACTTTLPSGAQGDVNPPGTCGSNGFVTAPVSSTCTGTCAAAATDGIPIVSGNYLISSNFFRTRDTMRQDLIDEAQLIRVMAFDPSAGLTSDSVDSYLAATYGFIVDPLTIYYSGQSLGSIQGAANVATNPRISKAVFNVGGGTVVDVFTNSPSFTTEVDALLASLGIFPGTSAYLQFLVVAKTVLDPADPINFVGHLTHDELPNLLPPLGGSADGSVPQTAKTVLTQNAYCDQTVPNPFNFIYASNIPTGPLPTGAAFFGGGTGTFQLFVGSGFDPATFGSSCTGAVEHGFLTDWLNHTITQNAQTDLVNFVTKDILPSSVRQ